jgi:myo-inositol-1(or 4)-monophosphatase
LLELDALIGLSLRAGEIALRTYGRAEAQRKADRSFVTEADRAVERFLREESARLAPGIGYVGEESEPRDPDAEHVLVADAIDGTGSFVDALPTWSVSIALCRNGEPVRGVVRLPVVDETYATEGEALWWNGDRVHPGDPVSIDGESRLLVSSRSHRRFQIRFPGKIRSLGSTAYHLALVARGVAIGALLGRPRSWDLAAGVALVRAAGGDVTDLGGESLCFPDLLARQRPERPLVAAAAGQGEDVLGMFREVER